MDYQSTDLSKQLINEILIATGLPKTDRFRLLVWFLLHKITDRLGEYLQYFDQLVGENGLPAGSEWLLTKLCSSTQMSGTDNIPAEGPLLVVSNHPGTVDGLVLFSALQRQDILWIAHDIPAMRLLQNTSKHILLAPQTDKSGHFLVLRNAVRHLNQGGTLVYFASGGRDPDPAVYTGADQAISNWLNTFDIFAKYVPKLQVLPAIVSNVISPYWAKHLITRLRSETGWKLVLSEFSQVIYQAAFPGRLLISPAVSFGKPYPTAQIDFEKSKGDLRAILIDREKVLLAEHFKTRNNFRCKELIKGTD